MVKNIALDNSADQSVEDGCYNVVYKTLVGSSEGVMTFTVFPNREAFEEHYKQNMLDGTNRPIREVYEVVAQGISDDEVNRLIKSPANILAILVASDREDEDMGLPLRDRMARRQLTLDVLAPRLLRDS